MSHEPTFQSDDEDMLADLAIHFRGSRSEEERDAIAKNYALAVERLVRSGRWDVMPAPEDQLPDNWMPPSFFRHWEAVSH